MDIVNQINSLWQRLLYLEKRATVGGGGMPPSSHASRHQDGGSDEIEVTGLSGVLADPQTVAVDAAGALDGDGAAGTPLAVRVDGVTIIISGSNELEATGGTPLVLIEAHGITVDGGGDVVTTGVKGRFRIPYDYEIVRWSLLADQAGDVEFDVKVSAFGGSPASIVASAPPTLSGVAEDDDATLTGWTTTGSAGDEFEYEITGTPDAIERVTLVLEFERT
jgi:hypothetical protein